MTQKLSSALSRLRSPLAVRLLASLLVALVIGAYSVVSTPAFSLNPSNEALATQSPAVIQLNFLPIIFRTQETVRFAVIGDYGEGSQDEADVAALVKSWEPELIITTGDNNYPDGEASTIDENVGQFYHEFIFPYLGGYGAGADINRFFPSLGNHDWHAAGAQPYLDYFTLPGNERYYDFTWGPLHFFAVDSDPDEPDGSDSSSVQAQWLQSQLAGSTAAWNIIYFHHSPYSSGWHGNIDRMQWPFKQWGADLVLSGHDHTYERIFRDGLVYVVNGLGGSSRYVFKTPIEGSQVRYNGDYGAMVVEASELQLSFQFINRANQVIDSYQLGGP
jgi:hypothetical protein